MTGQKHQAGDAFASLRQQRRVKTARKVNESGDERKPVEMKNIIEKQDASAATAPTKPEEATEELFNPQEWEALLHSFENEPSIGTVTRAQEPPIELSTEDLWERLSSTRWIRTPTPDDRDSTVAQRASD